MGVGTSIQWCDDTGNPVMGCDGCELWTKDPRGDRTCYAGNLHTLRRGHKGYAPDFLTPTMFPGRLAKLARQKSLEGVARSDKPWLDGHRRMIFVSDMGDALSQSIPFSYLYDEIILAATSEAGLRHDWLWLTKQPQEMAEFCHWLRKSVGLPWPANVWVGTSITVPGYLKRVEHLRNVGDEKTTRFLSIEPQRARIEPERLASELVGIRWVIQGGASGTNAHQFDVAWAREVRDVVVLAGKVYFLKQLGAHPVDAGVELDLRDSHGGDWSEWAEEFRIRRVPIGRPA